MGNGTTGNLNLQSSAVNYCDNLWRHVCIVFDNVMNKYTFYLNGIHRSSSVTGTGLENVQRSYNYLGKSSFSTDSYGTILIDDFRFYASALTQSSICNICGNTYYINNVLLASLFNAYVPFSSVPTPTNYMISQGNLDFRYIYAMYSSGTKFTTNMKCTNSLIDIGTIFNQNTINTINNPITYLNSCTVLGNYGIGPWGWSWGITGTNPFTSSDMWIYTTANDLTNANTTQYSFQQSYIATTTISASLTFMADNNVNAIYINKINVTPAYTINNINITMAITLLPGTNLIDLYCQNSAPGPAGLVF